jgi:uncharacterized protein YbbC (DUF1343 family)/CubicO group peptidase (beta-lactamase class C family)
MNQFHVVNAIIASLAIFAASADAPAATIDRSRLRPIDDLMQGAIDEAKCPGGVVLVGCGDEIVWRKAYGFRTLHPKPLPTEPDTIYDMASVTKVVATATSVAILIERGQLSLDDRAVKHIPELDSHGKDKITIEQLLTHRSGLTPDNSLRDYADGPDVAMQNIYDLDLRARPGEKFIYSDVGYILLGEIVERVSGMPLDAFAERNIFRPAGMRNTRFNPPKAWCPRCAAEEKRGDAWMRGQVHDPRAYALGGVAGHAGLFSTADDLARYCRMILAGGEIEGNRILAPMTIREMTHPRPAGTGSGVRGLGFDIATGYSSPRGDYFPRYASFGHTGFTGTSFWIDPTTGVYTIILTNRVHPDGKGDVVDLRRKIATVVAAAIDTDPFDRPWTPCAPGAIAAAAPQRDTYDNVDVKTGLDVLVRDGFKILTGRKVGVITNHTGLDQKGRHIVDIMSECSNFQIAALFSPEHGFKGVLDQKIGNQKHALTGLTIHSLYGETRIPTEEMLAGVDTLVFDIQDIGARFYTYIATMGNAMRAAAKNNIRMVVLDRPNPIRGTYVDGPIAPGRKFGFTAFYPMPVTHGMTVGELARLFNKELDINCDLTVVEMENWRRDLWYDQTGLLWVDPSPNMRNLTQALLYPGVGLIEATNVSVGRGTDEPFERFGAPWIDARKLAAALNDSGLPGVRFVPIQFTPDSSKHAGKTCGGVHIIVTNRETIDPILTGLTIAWQLERLFGDDFDELRVNNLLMNEEVLKALMKADNPRDVIPLYRDDVEAFKKIRAKYLIYR